MSKKDRIHDRGRIVDVVGALRSDRLLLTEQDAARLRSVVAAALEVGARGEAASRDALELLATALRSAVIVPPERIPTDVVTMRSRLVVKDVDTGVRREVLLVYPEEESAHDGRISVLSPLGVALLGLSEGALVEWPLPSGSTTVLAVESVRYQPEAAMDFHL